MLTRLLPGPVDTRPLDDPSLGDWLGELYALTDRRTVRLNMIGTVNGSAIGVDGTSESLTTDTDRRVLGILRTHADAVVVGGRTVRREGLASPRRARLAIVSRSGDLTGHRLDESASVPIVLCPPSASDAVASQLEGIEHEIVEIDGEAIDPQRIVDALRERGLESIVCEGGPTLASAFLDSGLVDEICMTTAPMLRSPGLPMLGRIAELLDVHLAHLLVDADSYVYARWIVDGRHV